MMMKRLKEAISKTSKRLEYIKACYEGRLIFTDIGANSAAKKSEIRPVKRAVVLKRIEDLGLEKGFYVHTEGYSVVNQCECDEDGIKALQEKIKDLEIQISHLEKKDPTDLWKTDLLELRNEYLKIYNEDGTVKTATKSKKK
jgi:hypothetical protein